jgi:cytochrome b pre-mRNA-processing protein 3
MIMSLFRRNKKNDNEKIVSGIYSTIIEAGRNPILYADWGIPDTPLGRYEAIGLHMILFLHRTRSAGPGAQELAQNVLDEFFLELDHSIRELGVGDAGVPKRMKKLGKMFYGRMGPYWKALDNKDAAALGNAVKRNVAPEDSESLNSDALATYMLAGAAHLEDLTDEMLLRGGVSFPQPQQQSGK